jgi:hypothetical protein
MTRPVLPACFGSIVRPFLFDDNYVAPVSLGTLCHQEHSTKLMLLTRNRRQILGASNVVEGAK